MRVLITGGAGMLGRRLAARLVADGGVGGRPVEVMRLLDVAAAACAPALQAGAVAIETVTGDLAAPGVAAAAVAERPELIFHLAAVVSGEAEADFDKGYRVNLDGTRALLEAIRAAGDGYVPRLVFSSSIAVFGPPFPDVIEDDQPTTPATSYGTEKAIGELLLADYTRRALLDGVGIRLPTICVRPGRPNRAASGFFSGIIREPLNGDPAALPVSVDVRHWFASPRAAVRFLIHAASLDGAAIGSRRSLTMPGVSATVADQIEALRRVAGDEAVALIHPERDETIAAIVAGWPRSFDARRAHDLGFRAERSFDEIVWAHVEDELGGMVPSLPDPPGG